MFKLLELGGKVLFSLLDSYSLPILVFPFLPLKWKLIPQAQDEAHLFSPKCSFLKAFHIAWRKALYPKIHHRDGRVAISHALLKQE